MQEVIYTFDYFGSKPDFVTKNVVKSGDSVFFNNSVPIEQIHKHFKRLENLRVFYIRYKLVLGYSFSHLRSKIKQNYVYEPELSPAIIWIQPGIKTYFFQTHCEVFISNPACLEEYILNLINLIK